MSYASSVQNIQTTLEIGNVVNDNTKILFGTGSDSAIYYDATNLVIDPAVVGSGYIDSNGGDAKFQNLGIGGSNPGPAAFITAFQSGSIVVTAYFGQITWTGASAGAVITNFLVTTIFNPSDAPAGVVTNTFAGNMTAANELENCSIASVANTIGAVFTVDNRVTITSGNYVWYGATFSVVDTDGGPHAGNISVAYGGFFNAIPTSLLTGFSSTAAAGIVCLDNIGIAADKVINFEAAALGFGNTTLGYDSAATEIQLVVDGTSVMQWDHDLIDAEVPLQVQDRDVIRYALAAA